MSDSAWWFVGGLAVGLLLGWLVSLLYWRRRQAANEARIREFQGSLAARQQSVLTLETRLKQQEAAAEQLRGQMRAAEERITALTAELEEQRRLASRHEAAVREREVQIEALQAGVEDGRAEAGRLAAMAQEQQTLAEQARSEADQAKEQIRVLAAQVEERGQAISRLEALLQEKEDEIAELGAGLPGRAAALPLAIAEASDAAPRVADDLQRIEGIGPKISALLQAAGIGTFAQLAATEAGWLERIVREAGWAMIDPGTWPEQASLASAGAWDALEALQADLKGGRRV